MTTIRFVSQWHPVWAVLSAIVLAGLAWWLYRRELKPLMLGRMGWLIPGLRAAAVFLIALTLAEPMLESRHREGEPGAAFVLLDGSLSMSAVDALEELQTDATAEAVELNREAMSISRFERATMQLLDSERGVLPPLLDQFELAVFRSDEARNTQMWQSTLREQQAVPLDAAAWEPNQWSQATHLGEDLLQLKHTLDQRRGQDSNQQAVVVLMTDGQSNEGESPIQAAEQFAAAGIPVYIIGYGPKSEPPDLAVRSVVVPERIYRTDQLRGTMVIADNLASGNPMIVQVVHDEVVVWQQSLTSEQSGQREIDFSFPIESIFDREAAKLPPGAEYTSLPLRLDARISSGQSEVNQANNSQGFQLRVASQKSRILLVDGRSRWETRYLRNLFARDPAWEIDVVIEDSQGDSSNSESRVRLPTTREDWLRYNLIFIGDVPSHAFDKQQLGGLVDYVQRGGGLVLIDGARAHLRSDGFAALEPLIPVQWKMAAASSSLQELPKRMQLAHAGQGLDALQLTLNNEDSNDDFWESLPAVQFVAEVEAKIGAEVLVNGKHALGTQPLMVTQRVGAGRVLYMASDETWRWRFKVADLVHQRLWNQLARWVMRTPMSVENEFVSLDTGAATYAKDAPIEIRSALRTTDGQPAMGRRVVANLLRDDIVVSRIPLSADDGTPGNYSSVVNGLPVGEYQVRIEAEGFAGEALRIESAFAVTALRTDEMQRMACNEDLLQQIATRTNGVYLHETEVETLAALLQPLSGGRITRSATLIWQTYWWFVIAVLLLVLEWILRKRVGLI